MIGFIGMRKNWSLSTDKEEAIPTLTERYDNQPPKVRKILPLMWPHSNAVQLSINELSAEDNRVGQTRAGIYPFHEEVVFLMISFVIGLWRLGPHNAGIERLPA